MGWYLFVSDIRTDTDLSKDEILGEIIYFIITSVISLNLFSINN